MGNDSSKHSKDDSGPGAMQDARHAMRTQIGRVKAIVASKPKEKEIRLARASAKPVDNSDQDAIREALGKLLLFDKLSKDTQRKIVADMYERKVHAGDILIQQGDTGLSASQLYVVKEGTFEVLERRKGVMFKVNTKQKNDVFGEISLMYSCPRSATVAATTDAVVYVLDREQFRMHVQMAAEESSSQVEIFMNSVPLLNSLTREQKLQLVDAFVEEMHPAGTRVITEGESGDKFYIIQEGEAIVYAGEKEVNRLFKADFFGEQALLKDEPRKATVKANTNLTVLSLDRFTFTQVLGPLQKIMDQEKSVETLNQRMAKLHPQSSAAVRRPQAEVIIQIPSKKSHIPRIVKARGHLDEVNELKRGGIEKNAGSSDSDKKLVLVEAELLGEGAFSRVVRVQEESTGREFAMKRITKSAALQCPEHIFCEQQITKNMAHPFCLRQYASFQDKFHLFFLFDLMPGGDLMDVLVAEAKVIKYPVDNKSTVKMWQGMDEELSKFYVASIVLALEYLHNGSLVFRDLKPENVLIDQQGYAKLGDFGFAKSVEAGSRTYTFCGTPGYVAPENIMGRGYNHSVDWFTLGVLMYVLLTARQPFTSPKTADPMEVMRRIVDEKWPIKYPPYMSPQAQDLIARLLERKPVKRIGMLQGRAGDIKSHPWFQGFDWDALSSRRMPAPRKPKAEDSSKRKAELQDAHKEDPPEPTCTPEEMAEFDIVFKDF